MLEQDKVRALAQVRKAVGGVAACIFTEQWKQQQGTKAQVQ
jgi:hypothetical protein